VEDFKRLLSNNRAWVEAKLAERGDYFSRHSEGQQPAFLWIGCSDSRVPSEVITGVEPGELFVHRNVANVVLHTDFNVLSVVQYAVEILEVDHVIVCGHYGCGGVKAAMSRQHVGLIDQWLWHIKDVYRLHADELDAIEDEEARFQRLVELNVREQARHVAGLPFVQMAWQQQRRPTIHGWVYDLASGYLEPHARIDPSDLPHEIYGYEL
jgi:carbonic anhydrase